MKTYKKRILDKLIDRRSQTAGAILVEGIKWCGKTTTCEQSAKSVIYMDEPEKRDQNLLMAKIRPSEILDGGVPRLIDEWQLAPTCPRKSRSISRLVRPRKLLGANAQPPWGNSEIPWVKSNSPWK